MHREPNRYDFEIPRLQRSLLTPLGVDIFALALATGIVWMVMRSTKPEDPIEVRIYLCALPAAIGIIGPLFALGRGLNRRTQRKTITVTPLVALTRNVRQRWTQRSTDLPTETIEEFGYTPMAPACAQSANAASRPTGSAAISVRTNFKRLYLGQGLRRSEQIWLHDAIKYLLVQAGKQPPG